MRGGPWLLVFTLSGCSGFFEDNPEFFETEGASEASADDTVGDASMCEADAYELNDEVALQAPLPAISPQTGNSDQVSVMLEGPGAVDWYVYDGVQDGASPRHPKVTADDEGIRVCVYLKCADGSEPAVECGADEPAVTPHGHLGCCGLQEARPVHSCGGVEGGDAFIDVRISDALDRGTCLPYQLDYAFF